MRPLLLILLLTSCHRHASEPTRDPFADAQTRRDEVVAAFDVKTIKRCDFATFAPLFGAFTARSVPFHDLETLPGKWERDREPCYPDASQSETSQDSYLSVLHYAMTVRDWGIPQRMLIHAKPPEYRTGAGPLGVVSIAALVPTIIEMEGFEALVEEEPSLVGFRGHLVAMFVWLRARVRGSVSDLELSLLREAWEENLQSPLLTALFHRLTDGDQADAIEKLAAYEPSSGSPFGWGSCPPELYIALTVAALEGR